MPLRPEPNQGQTVGLIAGAGRLPVLQAEGLRAAGLNVAGLRLIPEVDPALPGLCTSFGTAPLLRPATWARKLVRVGVREAVLVGKIEKHDLATNPVTWARLIPSPGVVRLFWQIRKRDMRSQSLLNHIADMVSTRGLELIDTTRYIPEHLATQGVMTRRKPTDRQRSDVTFGWPILMRLNELDVGQAMAVQNADVAAVEALEGTDRMIERTGMMLKGKGWRMLKGAPASKDPRFDVPTVGLRTIELLKAAGADCLALAAGRVIMVDKPKVIEAADAAGICVLGVEPSEAPA
ncbi:MAG: UDP-2,3-diacylglucosamine diphosphatase LpxI [Planctomycetota bacterium]